MTDVLSRILLVGLGGFAGANARYWLGGWISHRWGATLPWATFAINVSGSFALGVFVAFIADRLVHPGWRLVVPIGFIGRIDKLMPVLGELVTEGLVTLQDVHVFKYVHDSQASLANL